MTGSYEHCEEPLRSINDKELNDQLSITLPTKITCEKLVLLCRDTWLIYAGIFSSVCEDS
jgi:hypothetical protein